MSWLQWLYYSKSVRDLVQWSLRFLRDPQALSSTLASLGMLQPRAFGSLKMRRDLGLSLYLSKRSISELSEIMDSQLTNQIAVFVTTTVYSNNMSCHVEMETECQE